MAYMIQDDVQSACFPFLPGNCDMPGNLTNIYGGDCTAILLFTFISFRLFALNFLLVSFWWKQ